VGGRATILNVGSRRAHCAAHPGFVEPLQKLFYKNGRDVFVIVAITCLSENRLCSSASRSDSTSLSTRPTSAAICGAAVTSPLTVGYRLLARCGAMDYEWSGIEPERRALASIRVPIVLQR
jgi:hypothetical protein